MFDPPAGLIAEADQEKAWAQEKSAHLLALFVSVLIARKVGDDDSSMAAMAALKAELAALDRRKALVLVGWLLMEQLAIFTVQAGGEDEFLAKAQAGESLPCPGCGETHEEGGALEGLFQ